MALACGGVGQCPRRGCLLSLPRTKTHALCALMAIIPSKWRLSIHTFVGPEEFIRSASITETASARRSTQEEVGASPVVQGSWYRCSRVIVHPHVLLGYG